MSQFGRSNSFYHIISNKTSNKRFVHKHDKIHYDAHFE